VTDDLKRCPFCGGEPKVFYHDTKWFGPTCHIECLDDNCGCGTCHHESAEIAATVWNRRIEAQAVEIEELKSWKAAEDAHHHKLRAEIETLKTMIFATGEAAAVNLRTAMERALEIERLREAGGDLGFYAGHDDSCDCVKGWAKGPCNCGYTEAWQAWRAALGETE